MWFVVRMFREACVANQLHVVSSAARHPRTCRPGRHAPAESLTMPAHGLHKHTHTRLKASACILQQVQFMLERGLDLAAAPLQGLLHEVVAHARYDDSTYVGLVKILADFNFNFNFQVCVCARARAALSTCWAAGGPAHEAGHLESHTPRRLHAHAHAPLRPQPGPQYTTALHAACDKELVTLAEAMLDAGADVNAVAEVGGGQARLDVSWGTESGGVAVLALIAP
jgi:hypothetical protein